ncbi:MAG: flagellar type III secretion system pore protein FliP [Ignavibacteriota bacterium]|jgi:flagellar biosynthetic protein FliP|nr:MAG: flagellar type III secretion system pore protein FliP [Ignavibacterium sp.]MBL1153653.1 flagellar biosynthetic protein FliP [Ignavibacteriota bacterium]MCO6448215.1 flagellar type III secretion system pore protein FliP [Ignavibacterium album]MCZ2267999.1 flagellar type III secretion system pore protein FliP [Ignavibacteriales bacterium]MDX9711427.1 flagellar type III secretion system pore protein FliP [Ignavibacteriaceae bacterium]
MKLKNFITVIFILFVFASALNAQQTQSLSFPLPKVDIQVGNSNNGQDVSVTLQILLLMTILALAPSIMIMTTAYLRIIIVFHFLKSALGTQQMPPGQLLAGVALFITFFVMAPTWNKVNEDALKPLMDEKITTEEAYNKGIEPIREFMFKHVRDEDLGLFISLANMTRPNNRTELPTYIVIPAFVLSELRTGFIIGFFLFIPFLMVDMIIASILMSMGMMMVPPMLVSLPFKILLFILVDGWNLIVGSVVRSFG